MSGDTIKKMIGISIILFSLLAILLLRRWVTPEEKLVFCNVGQGDAILYLRGFTQVLVDAGDQNAQVISCLQEYLPPLDQKIEFILATHADADHIGGFPAVLEAYDYDFFILSPYQKGTNVYKTMQTKLLQNMRESRGNLILCPDLFTVKLSDSTRLEFWTNFSEMNNFCDQDFTENNSRELSAASFKENMSNISDNDLSIVTFLLGSYEQILLPGDLEVEGELALVQSGLLSEVAILKIGHHGSKSSSSLPLLDVTRPEISVVSVGENNRFGHPHPEILSRLADYSQQILRTDEQNDLVFIRKDQKWELVD